ncbi:hypothetical protein M501DRAFT_991804 [Patellaria atrata CBS 101060]|uniref:Uncharacterized protein n=1 Tax=Patellaria atrata CBS 101060 TaxID=1346257 RepID=A0A9P4SBV2_9PEZI|nr:hypothetical protein M501DRAFT_991804 [Patellaria atrata CBS 101060]
MPDLPDHTKTNKKKINYKELVNEYYRKKQPYLRARQKILDRDMPVHRKEEETGGDITDQVAKESSVSTASDHPVHQEDTGASSGGLKATAEHHKAHPGPAIPDEMPKAASREELQKRSEELNK